MLKEERFTDNFACEVFFNRMKNEIYYERKWNRVSIEGFIIITNEYIPWYNIKRIKKLLNYMSPNECSQP